MKKNIFIAVAAALALSFTACQKEESIVTNDNHGNDNTEVRVKSTSDLNNTDWTCTFTFADFLSRFTDIDTTCMAGMDEDTLSFGLNFDGTYAHFSFPDNLEAFAVDDDDLAQIYGISYTYSYDGATHTGHLNGVTEDEDGNEVPAQLQFTYNDSTDEITFVLPLVIAEDDTPVNLTLVFVRNE